VGQNPHKTITQIARAVAVNFVTPHVSGMVQNPQNPHLGA